jgi:hypothetical protein
MEPTDAASEMICCAGVSFFGRRRHCGIRVVRELSWRFRGYFLDFLGIALELAMTDGGTVRAYRATATATDEARPETPDVALARAVVFGEALGAERSAGTVRVDGAWRSAPALGPAHDFDGRKTSSFGSLTGFRFCASRARRAAKLHLFRHHPGRLLGEPSGAGAPPSLGSLVYPAGTG